MKHIYKGLVVCATLAFGSMGAFAQDEQAYDEQTVDSLGKIHVAFRTTDKQDLLGAVSVIDVEDFSEPAYTTGLDFLQNLVYLLKLLP